MNLQELFSTYLNKQKDVSDVRQMDGHSIFFDRNGLHYYFYYDSESDPYYFRIMLPYVDTITDGNKKAVLEKCSELSTNFKVGKAIILQNNQVWLSVESFIYDIGDNLSFMFDRMIMILRLMIDKYREVGNEGNVQ